MWQVKAGIKDHKSNAGGRVKSTRGIPFCRLLDALPVGHSMDRSPVAETLRNIPSTRDVNRRGPSGLRTDFPMVRRKLN